MNMALRADQLQQLGAVSEQVWDVALDDVIVSGFTWFQGMRANKVPIAQVLVRPENTSPAPITIGRTTNRD